MTTINDQPQHLLARYADRTGAKFEYADIYGDWHEAPKTEYGAEWHHGNAFPLRLVLSEYGLPSHLKLYKDNPRLPGDGYRVPTGEDSCNQPHEHWNGVTWERAMTWKSTFSRWIGSDYRLPASVLPPDWEEMTRENAPTVTSNHTSPQPEIFEAHDLEWYRHDGSSECPCDYATRTHWLITQEMPPSAFYNKAELLAKELDWTLVAAWRPTDAPAKLPRPGQQPQDEVQTLKARVQELEAQIAASTPTLRPVAEMPAEVTEGCVRTYYRKGHCTLVLASPATAEYFGDARMPDDLLSAPPDPDEELRREFEAWVRPRGYGERELKRQKEEGATYAVKETELLWVAYKAGRAKEGAR